MTTFKKAYSAMPRVQFATTGASLTRQESKRECDINRVMERFEKTGVLEHQNKYEGRYGDFLDVPQDYHSAVNQVMAAQEMFSELPSKVRKRFGNDPALYLEFLDDPKNAAEAIKLGLAEERLAEDATPIPKKEETPPKPAKKPVSDESEGD